MSRKIHNRETLRRVQIGLTGVMMILVLLTLGTALLSRLRPDNSRSTFASSGSAKSSNKSNEPLAKLGVAPADLPENKSTTDSGGK